MLTLTRQQPTMQRLPPQLGKCHHINLVPLQDVTVVGVGGELSPPILPPSLPNQYQENKHAYCTRYTTHHSYRGFSLR